VISSEWYRKYQNDPIRLTDVSLYAELKISESNTVHCTVSQKFYNSTQPTTG